MYQIALAVLLFMQLVVNFWEYVLVGTVPSQTIMGQALGAIVHPNFAGSTNILSAGWSIISNFGDIFTAIMQVILCYSPTVFGGDLYWMWYYVVAPISLLCSAFIVLGIFTK